ncbi:DUF2240 family protein, partial [Candidatus Woesearchaeota archaeon]|nr:DUF2240 family protein [Candidatus Woesearchaeota archaeon]
MSRGELMIKLGYDEIIERIVEKSDLDKAEIEAKITKKLKQLEGLISKEGAAHIVANQLGIKLIEKISGRLQIKNILSGMRDVETVGKIIRIYPARRFSVDGREGQVANMVIGDETSSIKLVLWGDHADQAKNAKQGMVVKVIGGYVKERDNTKELHLGTRGSLALNPRGETVAEVAIPVAQRKRINELKEGMNDVEVYGTVIQMFEPRFYEICPSCGKRMNQREDKFACETHGEQQPKLGYVLNLFLDDGLDTIRAVFFRQTALNLLNISDEQMC